MADAPSGDEPDNAQPTQQSPHIRQQQHHHQAKQHRSRSFSGLGAASTLLDMLAHRPKLFFKKSPRTSATADDTPDSPPSGSGKLKRRLIVPSQIVVSELCVDGDGEEFEVTWTAFDASWPSGGRTGGGSGGGGSIRKTRASSNSSVTDSAGPSSSHHPLRTRSLSNPEDATHSPATEPAAASSTSFSGLGVGSHRRDQTQETFRRSASVGRRNAVCVELDRRHCDSALSRFSEHAAIVDAMKQCF